MAHIFKNPSQDSKGIIVFTHKEWPWLLQEALPTVQNLRQYFYLGWNQGTYFGNVSMPNIVDFAFASPNCLTFPDNGRTININLLDRNFINDDFKDLNIKEKQFDIICVARAIKLKNLPSLLKGLRKLIDRGKNYKTLLVIPTAENETKEGYDIDIVEQYTKLFNHKERKNITLIRLSRELGFLGISPQTLNWFYNNSKVLYIGSDSEGGCRVVHEALLCGCDVVYWKNHRGALKDYLNESNSVAFDTYEEVDKALEQAVDNYSYTNHKGKKYDELLSETHAVEKLTPYFKLLYERDGMVFDGELINCNNLGIRLPAHYLDVPWNHPTDPTADIKTVEQLEKFINFIQNNQ